MYNHVIIWHMYSCVEIKKNNLGLIIYAKYANRKSFENYLKV